VDNALNASKNRWQVSNRLLALMASNKYARRFGVYLLFLIGRISSNMGIDPILERRLDILGVDATFAFHLLRMDLSSIVEVFLNHVYDRFCTLTPGATVVDCGAYIGEFTVYAAEKVGESGLVLAFEPNPQSFSLCKRNIDRNRMGNVKVFEVALGQNEGAAFLHVNRANLGASSITNSQIEKPDEEVAVRTLDQFFPILTERDIELLKIDAEGFGLRILLGARSLLEKKKIRNVSAEVHPGEEEHIQKLLEQFGFACIRKGSYLYGSIESNPICKA